MANPTHRFQDKIVIVTGAGGGIGTAISKQFAKEGAVVIVQDVNEANAQRTADEIAAEGGRATPIASDISQSQQARDLIAFAIEKYGRVDVLCNNAGINIRGPLLEISDEDWHRQMAVNLDSMFYLSKAVVPHMQKQGGGAIVNTASQVSLQPAPNACVYSVSKAAVASLTQSMARDYAPDKIRVNAVCPGEVNTPMLAEGLKRKGKTVADYDKLVPYGRIGKPEEIGSLVAFLASDEAAFMCGSLVEIHGAQPVG